jgi:hypothetical protein
MRDNRMKSTIIVLSAAALWIGNVPDAISQGGPPLETSADLTSKDHSKTYFSLKKSFKKIPTEYLRYEQGYPVTLSSCISAGELYGMDTGKRLPLTRQLSELAFEILWIDGSLKLGRYPSELWASDLSAIEQQALNKLQTLNGKKPPEESVIPKASRVALAQKLNNYRKDIRGTIPVKAFAYGCGDMMGPVLDIRTTPAAKQIQYMSQHFADLCADQGIHFSDDRCKDYWQDYSTQLMLHGKFVFVVRWASGPPVYRKWDLDKVTLRDLGGSIRLEVSQ